MIAVKCKEEKHYFLRISAAKDQSVYGIDITIPVTRLKKTSDCFLQWRDKDYGGAFGLNFVAEKDLKKFLKLCVPPRERSASSDHLKASTNSFDSQRSASTPNSGSNISLDSVGLDPPPTLQINSENLNDSGIERDSKPVIRKPLVPTRSSSGKKETPEKVYKESDIPAGYDPVEYDFLMKNKVDENANTDYLNLSNGPSVSGNNSLNNSFNLLSSKSFDDSRSTVSEDFQDSRPPSAINLNRQIMTTRKAAWLLVKNILIHSKKGKVELASHRKWKKYWVALKGVELVFYHANERTVTTDDLDEASYRLDIDCCIAQPVPEYARLENVFSLSTKHGNAYYFQATSSAEVENWIHCIHSSAAMALARRKRMDNIPVLLKKEIRQLREELHSDEKLRKMAQLQLKVEKELSVRQNINMQISQWDQSLEVRHANIFRLRCYLSAIDSTNCPNPQDLLTHVSRSTKQALAKIGIFSVTSFHSYVNARNAILPPPEEKPKSRSKVKSSSLKTRLMNSLKIADDGVVSAIRSRHSPNERRKRASSVDSGDNNSNHSSRSSKSNSNKPDRQGRIGSKLYIQLPNSKTVSIPYEGELKISDLIERVCMKENLDSLDYFIMLITHDNHQHGLLDYTIPKEKSVLDQFPYSSIKLCPKLVYDALLTDPADYQYGAYGMELEQTKDGRILVTAVEDGSPARKLGLMVDDEVIQINGQNLRDLHNIFNDIKEVLNTSSRVSLKLRSNRIDDPKKTFLATENMINFLVCPPPPKSMQPEMTDDVLNSLIVPAPADFDKGSTVSSSRALDRKSSKAGIKNEDIDQFLMQTEAVNMMTREMNAHVTPPPVPAKMKQGVKLRKSVVELVETEKTYIKNLKILLERYLFPLKEEDFLSKDEAELLVANVREIYEFQLKFYDRLKEILRSEKEFDGFTETTQFHNVIYLIGETFLENVDKFKLYSTFCSCHSRAVKLLQLNTNETLKAFLMARNPKQQHTGTLESYLITPIQRILRYPLLMKTMLKYMKPDSEEFKCLHDALSSIEKVANYINEMQRISETYTPFFEELCKTSTEVEKADMGTDNLLHYGRVHLIQNGDPSTRRPSSLHGSLKQNGESLTIFIFKKAIILLSNDQKSLKKALSSSASMNSKSSNSDTKVQLLLAISHILLRDYAWSENDSDQIWQIVDTSNGNEITYTFLNRTGEEKKVFVNAIKESKKINKLSNSYPLFSSKRRTNEGILKKGDSSSASNNRERLKPKKKVSHSKERGITRSVSPIPLRKLGEKIRGRHS